MCPRRAVRSTMLSVVALALVAAGQRAAVDQPGATQALAAPATPSTSPPSPPPAEGPPPGEPAPPQVVAELQRALDTAIDRFDHMDLEGVLQDVSDRYRSGPLTKPALREQLVAMFATCDAVHARVRIDEVRMIGDRAWVYSTGNVTGRLRWLGTPTSLFDWRRAPEVAWRESGRWRLIGDQQP